jgi:hypothetical protein
LYLTHSPGPTLNAEPIDKIDSNCFRERETYLPVNQ